LTAEVISTPRLSCGVAWRGRHQDPAWFARLGELAGFRVEQKEQSGSIFRIDLHKLAV